MSNALSPLDPVVGPPETDQPSTVGRLANLLSKPALLHNEKRVILAFRSLVTLVAFAFFFTMPTDVHIPWQFYFVVFVFMLSNFVFLFEGIEAFNTHRAQTFIFAFDISMLTILMILLGLTNKEFYLVFFLTIFVSALSRRMSYALVISLVMSGLFIVFSVYGKTDVDFTSAEFLVRVVLFFVVSSFVGHISEVAEASKTHVQQLKKWKLRTEQLAMEHHKMAAVGLLAAGVAHEFNNLLAGIKGYADLAKMGAVEQDEFIQVVTEQCGQAAGIVRDLLSFSRKRGGDPEPQDVTESVEQVLRLVHKEINVREINVQRNIASVPKVVVEPGAIERIMLNLIQNALQAMEAEGTLRIDIGLHNDMVDLEVTDDGCGMTPEVCARAFEPFMSTRTTESDGVVHSAGLGLAVTKRLVEKAGGTIGIKSTVGVGTTVSIRLPLQNPEPENQNARAEQDQQSQDARLCPVPVG